MKRTRFIFKESYQQALDLIDDAATKAELMLAITDYGINGNPYQGENKIVRIAMALIMPQIDRDNRRYEIKEAAKENPRQVGTSLCDVANPNDLNALKAPQGFTDLESFKSWLNDNTPNIVRHYEVDKRIFKKITEVYSDNALLCEYLTGIDKILAPDFKSDYHTNVGLDNSLAFNIDIIASEKQIGIGLIA